MNDTMPSEGDRRPIPDPTLLTTAQLRRELSTLQQLLEARLNAMDKATELLNDVTKFDLSKQIGHIKELYEEKFASIQTQFRERDVRFEQDKIAGNVAVNAALQAQKEAAGSTNASNSAAITKAEAATTKQIDGILALLTSNTKAIDDKITVINARLDRAEGGDTRVRAEHAERNMTAGTVLGIVSGAVGILALLAALSFGVMNLARSNPNSGSAIAVAPLNPSALAPTR